MAVCAWNPRRIYDTASTIPRIRGTKNRRVGKGIPLIIFPNEPPGKFFVSCSCNLKFGWSRSFVSRWVSTSARSNSKHSFKLEPQTSPWSLCVLTPLNQQAKGGITALGGVIDSDYHGNTGLLLHKGGKKDYVWWSTRDPLGPKV